MGKYKAKDMGYLVLFFIGLAVAGTRPGVCSNFAKVWQAYPSDAMPSDQLLAALGGDMSWMSNTCAIRTTMALRAIGMEAGDIANARWKDGKRRKYLIRVKEMNEFMRLTFGPPNWVGYKGKDTGKVNDDGEPIWENPDAIMGKAGLIRYSDCPFSDASGHFDVWDGYKDRGHGYPRKCNKKEVWNLCNPIPNPDYAQLWAHMKKTNAWDKRGRPVVGAPPPSARNGRPAPRAPVVDVKRSQELLNQLSVRLRNRELHSGVADGLMGRNTRRAVRAFQRLASLPVTGELNSETFTALEKY